MKHAEEFFSDLKEWSARKLSIIKKYIDGFSRILGSKFKSLYYVDGFAGKGVYDDGEKGSPVLAAELSENLRKKGESYILFCINVEKDHEIFSNLCNETTQFGKFVENLEGSFGDNTDNILSKIKGNPAIFFIDDFGVRGTDWVSVEKVISRKDSTDIWIRFDHKTVCRLAGFFCSDAKDAQGKQTTLQNLFGIDDIAYLKARLGSGNSPEDRIENAVNLYLEQLEKIFDKFGKKGFAAAYPIISIDGQRKYHLVFACSHPKAATLASNIVNGIEETFQHEKEEYKEFQTGQMSLFSSDMTEKQVFYEKVSRLIISILQLPKGNSFTREELHYGIMVKNKKWFGTVGRKHLTQALRDLLKEAQPKIKCLGTPGSDDAVITIIE